MKYVFISIAIFCAACSSNDLMEIRSQLDGMEEAWRKGDKLGVAQFYSDDGYLISSGKIRAHGREEINEYWEGFSREPEDWILTEYKTSQNLADVISQEAWKISGLSVPDWNELGVSIPDGSYYQLGKSELIWQTDGVKDTGTVNFFLVWKKVNDAYLIYVDAYN